MSDRKKRSLFDRLVEIERRYHTIEQKLGDPELTRQPSEYRELAKEHAELAEIVEKYGRYLDIKRRLEENQELVREEKDIEIRKLAQQEIPELSQTLGELEEALRLLLLPKDPHADKNVFLEIRAGTGGEEAGIFAADLFRMYTKYAEKKGWRVDVVDSHETGVGGFKEIIAFIEGKDVYSQLKFESGVHRVQRVPVTESQGRIHTSAVTVAVLPEAEDVEVQVEPSDLKMDVFRSSGPGGQSVNTTDSAVRVTHLPSGLVVTCQDEKSQHKNRAKALRVLKARLLDRMQAEQQEVISMERRTQVGTGDRSERIRTYNFPQNRVTDHRIGLTLQKLENVLEGDLDELIRALLARYRAEAFRESAADA